MKPLCLAFVLLLISVSCWANRIDDLKTDKDVADFVMSLDSAKFYHKNYSPSYFVPTTEFIYSRSSFAAKNKVKNWQKTDFNNDGLTDILVLTQGYGIQPYVVIDKGNDTFKLLPLEFGDAYKFEPAKIIKLEGKQLVLMYPKRWFKDNMHKYTRPVYDSVVVDTLIYRFDGFVEYNANPKPVKLVSVTFTASTCYGTCPRFTLKVNANGTGYYKGEDFAKPQGDLDINIPAEKLIKLREFLNYIDFSKLKDDYSIHVTDQPTYTLSIVSEDGSVKNIKDYGGQGTRGLAKIYSLFFDMYADLHSVEK